MLLALIVRGADGQTHLATRWIDQSQINVLPGTEGAQGPFFSPDGRWIAFSTKGALKKIAAQGGAPDLNTAAMIQTLQATMADDAGPFRTQAKLERALRTIGDLTTALGDRPAGNGGPFDMRRIEWLDLRNINATSPDPQIYGEFDDFLFWSMPRETEAFFEEILSKDLSLSSFVHSDWTFLNQRLAQHYGIKDVFGGELRKVKLPANSHRGGVLTQASILKVTADGTRTSPVLRGKWVLEKIIGKPPAPPPPSHRSSAYRHCCRSCRSPAP